jgi:cell division protein FtsW (lipid II flippase)
MMHNFPLRHLGIAVGVIAVAILALTWLGLPWTTVLPLGIVALCPLMMIVMMMAMGHQDGGGHSHTRHDDHQHTRL